MFQLDSRLQNDTYELCEFPLCKVLLANDSQYPWLILVPKRADVCEVFELSEQDQLQLNKESTFVAQILSKLFNADKINVAALGNVVNQLHIHHVARFEADANWPKPIWGALPTVPYSDEQILELSSVLKDRLDEF
jgi:diadenosine tetraphosphate (Ap4A) HIT family hydrolase